MGYLGEELGAAKHVNTYRSRAGFLQKTSPIQYLPQEKLCYNRAMQHAVLVLNANFEPLNVCNVRRAVGLLLMGKASLVLNGRGVIHTVSCQIDIPSVIRLELMIKRPHPVVKLCKREILRRDYSTCQYCGKQSINMTVDHVIPRHIGGASSWENMVTACPSCNHRKGGRMLEQAKMFLMRKPTKPPASVSYLFRNSNNDWEPFLNGW